MHLKNLQNVLIRIQEIREKINSLFPSVNQEVSFQKILKNEENRKENLSLIESKIKECSLKYNVPASLIKAIIEAESNFNPDCISRKGASGLMQLMPETARGLGIKDIFDIEENIEGGVKYFRYLLEKFNNNYELALAAYNAGPGAVEKYGGIPPYSETQNYVSKVLRLWEKYRIEENKWKTI
jgi:soluble lytic murein transglycosylase-like protein